MAESKTFFTLATWASVRTFVGRPTSSRPSLNILCHSKTLVRLKASIPISLFNEFKGLRRGFSEFKAKVHSVALLARRLHKKHTSQKSTICQPIPAGD